MRSAHAETSDRYEKLDANVFRMKPIGAKPRRRILTPYGRAVIFIGAVWAAVLTYVFFK